MSKSKFEEYQICQERGHEASAITASIPPQSICSRCGTYYYYSSELVEHNVPTAPTDTEKEEG